MSEFSYVLENTLSLSDIKDHEFSNALSNLHSQHQIFESVTSCSINADYCHSFPPNFIQFQKLCKLTVKGQRWYHADCRNLPVSLVSLDLNSLNLWTSCIKGMERLKNLEMVKVSIDDFGFESIAENPYDMNEYYHDYDPSTIIPIPNIFSLQTIRLYHGDSLNCIKIKKDADTLILNHPLLVNIKQRIDNIEIIENPLEVVISLNYPKIQKLGIKDYSRKIQKKIGYIVWLLNQTCSFDNSKKYKEYLPVSVALDGLVNLLNF